MKAVLLLAAVVAAFALSSAAYDNGNGKPICTKTNVATGKFRNNWDPTRYWLCSTVDADAQSIVCPEETGFLDAKKECVSWLEWKWTPPSNPPTD